MAETSSVLAVGEPLDDPHEEDARQLAERHQKSDQLEEADLEDDDCSALLQL